MSLADVGQIEKKKEYLLTIHMSGKDPILKANYIRIGTETCMAARRRHNAECQHNEKGQLNPW